MVSTEETKNTIEENKKLEQIMQYFWKLSYEEKREGVISLVSSLWESEVYARTLEILKDFTPSEEYISDIYKTIMEAKLKADKLNQENEKKNIQQKMEDSLKLLNERSQKLKEQDEKEAEDILNMI